MTRDELHETRKREMLRLLRAKLGKKVRIEVMPRNRGHDFIIRGQRISLRVGGWRVNKHKIVQQRLLTGEMKRYQYEYEKCHFNFHEHNKPTDTDVFICLAVGRPKNRIFVIPRQIVTGRTFSLHRSTRGNRYHGKYAPFEDRWNVVKPRRQTQDQPVQAVA